MIKWRGGRAKDVMINTGKAKNTLANLVGGFRWSIEAFHPQVVSLDLGLEGVDEMTEQGLRDYKGNLDYLIMLIRNMGAIPIVQLPAASYEKEEEKPMVRQLWTTIMNVCNKNDVIVVDHPSHWKKFQPKGPLENPTVKVDGFNFILQPYPWTYSGMYPSGAGQLEMFRKLALDLGFEKLSAEILKANQKPVINTPSGTITQ